MSERNQEQAEDFRIAIQQRDAARAEAASLRERLATFGCVRCPDEDDNDLAQGYCPKHGEKLRDRNDELEAEITRLAGHRCDSMVLPPGERDGLLLKAAERVTTAEARATAAEGQRDEWEGRWLERGDDLKLAEGDAKEWQACQEETRLALESAVANWNAAEGERDRLRDENARLRGLLPAETLDEFARRVTALQNAAAAIAVPKDHFHEFWGTNAPGPTGSGNCACGVVACKTCLGSGTMATEMGCFGPKRFGRCTDCNATGVGPGHTEGEASAPPKERCRVPMEPTDLDRGLCQRGRNHTGGHCLYDIDAAVASGAPPKETP